MTQFRWMIVVERIITMNLSVLSCRCWLIKVYWVSWSVSIYSHQRRSAVRAQLIAQINRIVTAQAVTTVAVVKRAVVITIATTKIVLAPATVPIMGWPVAVTRQVPVAMEIRLPVWQLKRKPPRRPQRHQDDAGKAETNAGNGNKYRSPEDCWKLLHLIPGKRNFKMQAATALAERKAEEAMMRWEREWTR